MDDVLPDFQLIHTCIVRATNKPIELNLPDGHFVSALRPKLNPHFQNVLTTVRATTRRSRMGKLTGATNPSPNTCVVSLLFGMLGSCVVVN